jgi:uncharacterized ParB-like nuclease family protein
MAKRQEIPDILAQERQRMNVLDEIFGAPKAVDIRIADIRRDGATQPRAGLDPQHVEDLIQALTDDVTLPAIDVMFDGTFYWLYDGFHRVAAHERIGRTKIAAKVQQGAQSEAQWESYAVNQDHGLKRSNEDKARAAKAALRHPKAVGLSNVQIAKHVGVDEKTIRYYRERLESSSEIPKMEDRTVTRGGVTYTQSTSNIGSSQPQRANTYESSIPSLNVVPSEATGSRQQGAQLATCRICHRPLSDPASAIAGVGPCCAAKRTTAAGSNDAARDVLTPDRSEATSAAQKRNERIDSVLRRLYAAQAAASEFEELTGVYTHTPAFRRVMDNMISVLEANRI